MREEWVTAQRLEFIKLRLKRLDDPLSEIDDLEGLDALGCGKPERREPVREQRGVLPEHLIQRAVGIEANRAQHDPAFGIATARHVRCQQDHIADPGGPLSELAEQARSSTKVISYLLDRSYTVDRTLILGSARGAVTRYLTDGASAPVLGLICPAAAGVVAGSAGP